MDEIKIWTIDGSDVQEIQPTSQTKSERWLEDNIVSKPELLMPGLTLVGRQTQTEGGPLDLLGVDSDGRLVLLELKRGTLSRDAVAQIVDYASDLEGRSIDALANHIASRSGTNGIEKIDDFKEWYAENTDADGLDGLMPLRMFLVGLGVDDRTERMVSFLANKGVDISLLTFYGFKQDGKTLLARLMPVEGRGEPASHSTKRRLSIAERREMVLNRAQKSSVPDLFDEIREMFRENWRSSDETFNRWGLVVRLVAHTGASRRRRAYARIDPYQSQMSIVFFRPAIELCMDEIRSLLEEIPYGTYPGIREGNPLDDPIPQIQFRVSANAWEAHKEKFIGLTQTVYDAWLNVN